VVYFPIFSIFIFSKNPEGGDGCVPSPMVSAVCGEAPHKKKSG
jgi:hypothetical protein